MDGVHDLGGMNGFGRVEYEQNEPVFHAPWQATAFAINMVSIGALRAYNADQYRHSVERMTPAHYFRASYYERMLTGAATLLVEAGTIDLDDLERRAGGAFPLAQPNADDPMADLTPAPEARFKVGDQVRVLDIHPHGHTRAPRFCRGRSGTVIRVAPKFTFPDTSAHGRAHRKEHTYHVEFAASELWNEPDYGDRDTVVVDLWDSYLEAV